MLWANILSEVSSSDQFRDDEMWYKTGKLDVYIWYSRERSTCNILCSTSITVGRTRKKHFSSEDVPAQAPVFLGFRHPQFLASPFSGRWVLKVFSIYMEHMESHDWYRLMRRTSVLLCDV